MKRIIICLFLGVILLLTSFTDQPKTKPLPSTKCEIYIAESQSLDEELMIRVNYGTTIVTEPTTNHEPNTALLKVHYLEKKEDLDIFEGIELLRVDNFLSKENEVSYKTNCTGKSKIVFNKEVTLSVPKEDLNRNSGIICFSFICYHLDTLGNINPNGGYDGVNIYFQYQIQNEIITFKCL